jgi:hypothetical protein
MTVSALLADQSAVRGVRKNARLRDKNCEQKSGPHMRGSASTSN